MIRRLLHIFGPAAAVILLVGALPLLGCGEERHAPEPGVEPSTRGIEIVELKSATTGKTYLVAFHYTDTTGDGSESMVKLDEFPTANIPQPDGLRYPADPQGATPVPEELRRRKPPSDTVGYRTYPVDPPPAEGAGKP